MKKFYTLICSALLGASAATAGVDVTFNGTDNAGWLADNPVSAVVADGHYDVVMTQTNGKYRADLKFTGSATLNPAEDKLFAIKFIGARPNGNMTLEMKTKSGTWFNTQWKNSPQGSCVTKGGNTIYYYNLEKDAGYTGDPIEFSNINLKIADNTAEPHSYSIDWIKTYSSLEALQADKNIADDGETDKDEALKQQLAVYNETTDETYNTPVEAWNAIKDTPGEYVIIFNEDVTLDNRIGNAANFTVTFKGKTGNEVVYCNDKANTIPFLFNQAGCKMTIENLTIDGSAVTRGNIVESQAAVYLNNVVFKNCRNTTNGNGIVQAKATRGEVHMNNVKFDETCTLGEGEGHFVVNRDQCYLEGDNDMTIKLGANSNKSRQFVRKGGELTNTKPINILLDTSDGVTPELYADVKAKIVDSCNDASKFNVINDGYMAKADGAHLYAVADDGTTGIEELTGDAEGVVDVYNLSGIKVRAGVDAAEALQGLPMGLYIVGGKKVMVK